MAKSEPREMVKRRPRVIDWSAVLTDARDHGRTLADVVRATGVTLPTVRRNARALAISLPAASSARKHIDWDRELARANLRGETASQLARRLKVGVSSVDKAKAQFHASLPVAKGGRQVCTDWPSEFQRARESGEHLSQLARRLGVPRQTVSAAAKRLGETLERKVPKADRRRP